MPLILTLPADCVGADAAAFSQDGKLLAYGAREHCEDVAMQVAGLYCWIDRGRAVIRRDFENREA
jgi:hypothetical protein